MEGEINIKTAMLVGSERMKRNKAMENRKNLTLEQKEKKYWELLENLPRNKAMVILQKLLQHHKINHLMFSDFERKMQKPRKRKHRNNNNHNTKTKYFGSKSSDIKNIMKMLSKKSNNNKKSNSPSTSRKNTTKK